jgi:adenylate cyclase
MIRLPIQDFIHRAKAKLVSWVRRLGVRAYLIFALVFSVVIVADWGVQGFVSGAEIRLFDTLISKRILSPEPDPDIVILDIDEASLSGMAAKHGRWPWPNSVFGDLVRSIEAQQPQAIVFDILFSDRDSHRADSDAAFNAEIAKSKTTFFPMLRLDPQNDKLSRIPVGALPGVRPLSADLPAPDPQEPIAIILPKVPAAIDNGRLGTHQVHPDPDGIIRRYPSWIEHAGWRIPSLPQRMAEEFNWPGASVQEALLNWRGPPFTYHYLPFVDVYRELVEAKVAQPGKAFAGKIVIIGSTAPSLFDVKGTPMARIHPGVEILATAIDNFKHGDTLRERPAWVMRLAALLLIWGMAIALYRQVHINVFDAVFGALQAGLLAFAFVVLNVSNWYLDTSAPLSLGLLYFTVARVYHGLAQKGLASSSLKDMAGLAQGTRLLAVMAIRLDGSQAAERRQLQGQLDRLVAASPLSAGRVVHLVEDPGFVQSVFADAMLVYWLCEDAGADWQADASVMAAALGQSGTFAFDPARLSFGRAAKVLCWNTTNGWTPDAFATILAALTATVSTPPLRVEE